MSRAGKTTINSIVGLTCSVISSVLSFVLQAFFIRLLGLEYSGINSLFSGILSMLNIAELGVSNAILFRLYRTIASGDEERTRMYLSTYRKICYVVASVIGISGLCCIPFLDKLVNKVPTFPESLWSLFVIVLATSVLQHLWDYKNIYTIAKQDRYISTLINYGCVFLCHGLQIFALAAFKNIYLFLVIKFATTALNGLLNGIVAKKKYNIYWKSDKKISKNEIKVLTKDVGSLAFYKFCRTLDATIDTFIISKFIDVATTAIYGSTSLLLNALNELLGTFNDGMIASIGDLYASKDKKNVASVFYQAQHFTFLLYGIVTATLTPILAAVTQLWIGYRLSDISIYIMLVNFYMYGLGMNIATFRNSMGLFIKGWKRPAVTAFLNLVFSVLLASKLGLIGTLLGTLLARCFTLVWYDPYIVIKCGMDEKVWKYYIRYFLYLIITFFISVVLLFCSRILHEMNSFIWIVFDGVLLGLISTGLFLLLGSIIPEQRQVLNRMVVLVKKVLR